MREALCERIEAIRLTNGSFIAIPERFVSAFEGILLDFHVFHGELRQMYNIVYWTKLKDLSARSSNNTIVIRSVRMSAHFLDSRSSIV